ncbi:MAG: hypothetical protein BroJett018_45630 [Chloroflexota bacterium]|nr:hypothetical protein [Chloroflexota bacterium]NOG65382.1 hypothetical protein [Chloroflexota bacterium]GIK66769.1 MAG: hypothetical protein BroJett018_45630 [Chloroflexota bacterium]
MRISIWQQFASNHSNSFTVVGEFERVEGAQNAADKLRASLQPIFDWYAANPEIEYDADPIPPELAIGKSYGVEWELRHDWLPGRIVGEVVSVLDNRIIIIAEETWSPHEPLDQILVKLGATVSLEGAFSDTLLLVDIVCQCPIEATAINLHRTLLEFMTVENAFPYAPASIPWIAYHSGQRASDAEELERIDKIFVTHEQIKSPYNPTNNDLRSKIIKAIFGNNRADIQRRLKNLPALTPDEESRVRLARSKCVCSLNIENNQGRVILNGTRLEIANIWFILNLPTALPAIIAWLKDNGCTNIRYTIRQEGEYG